MEIIRKKIALSSIFIITVILIFAEVFSCQQKSKLILIQDGKSSATIVVGTDASEVERFAARELQQYLERISGATLPIQVEDSAHTRDCVMQWQRILGSLRFRRPPPSSRDDPRLEYVYFELRDRSLNSRPLPQADELYSRNRQILRAARNGLACGRAMPSC